MQQAVLKAFPKAQSTHRFKNRSPNMLFSQESIEWFKVAVSRMSFDFCRVSWDMSSDVYFAGFYLFSRFQSTALLQSHVLQVEAYSPITPKGDTSDVASHLHLYDSSISSDTR